MERAITISESTFKLLRARARRARLSPNDMAERLLREGLTAEQQAWQAQWDRLIERMHARMAPFDPQEIELDITSASAEVKAKRRVSRRTR